MRGLFTISSFREIDGKHKKSALIRNDHEQSPFRSVCGAFKSERKSEWPSSRIAERTAGNEKHAKVGISSVYLRSR